MKTTPTFILPLIAVAVALAGCTVESGDALVQEQEEDIASVSEAITSGADNIVAARDLCLRSSNSSTGNCFRQMPGCTAVYVYSVDWNTGMARVYHYNSGATGWANKDYLTRAVYWPDANNWCQATSNGGVYGGGTG
ncbi:hypothetical protein WME99_51590 [Sorangium sp. So ce136]|uniref:hypothetical protein n=1 Tax=Sorangium sp. So ce136 TaxID=3133284 RepID=UPI003F00E3F5